jgi:hypothetical protein
MTVQRLDREFRSGSPARIAVRPESSRVTPCPHKQLSQAIDLMEVRRCESALLAARLTSERLLTPLKNIHGFSVQLLLMIRDYRARMAGHGPY